MWCRGQSPRRRPRRLSGCVDSARAGDRRNCAPSCWHGRRNSTGRRRAPSVICCSGKALASGAHGGGGAPRRRRRATPTPTGVPPIIAPNEVWCVDFKGWFRTGDGAPCYPLTVTDAFSRYLLCCRGVAPDYEGCRRAFERLFRERCLPQVLLSDNGPPFASLAAGGLSRLSVWWDQAGHHASAHYAWPTPTERGGMNACIRPLRRKPPNRRQRRSPPSSAASITSARSLTM